jgi:hypothetical protein
MVQSLFHGPVTISFQYRHCQFVASNSSWYPWLQSLATPYTVAWSPGNRWHTNHDGAIFSTPLSVPERVVLDTLRVLVLGLLFTAARTSPPARCCCQTFCFRPWQAAASLKILWAVSNVLRFCTTAAVPLSLLKYTSAYCCGTVTPFGCRSVLQHLIKLLQRYFASLDKTWQLCRTNIDLFVPYDL